MAAVCSMIGSDAARTMPVVSDDSIRDALRRHISRTISIDRRFTRAQLAAESGVNIHTIDAMLAREPEKHRRICFAEGLSLAWVIGPPAISSLLALIGWIGRPEDEAGLPNPMLIVAGAMSRLSVITTHAADGVIDHVEQPETQRAADELIAIVLPLSSAGKPP